MHSRPLVPITTGALLALLATVAAQSEKRALLEGLELWLLSVAVPLTAFVLQLVGYAAIAFRGDTDPRETAEKPALEVVWVVATVLVLLFVGVAAHGTLANPYVSPAQPSRGVPPHVGDDDAPVVAPGCPSVPPNPL